MFIGKTPSFYRIIFLFLVVFLSFINEGQGQFTIVYKLNISPTLNFNKPLLFDSSFSRYPRFSVEPYLLVNRVKPSERFFSVMPFKADYTFQNLGWFCKTEWKFQKISKIPLFLRLGSKSQTDFLEGKLR